ncbi:hypothetical protein KY308_02100, partial [Candidatus Woesearchaeota archaeon]|nr:hypothetical protein [Candidatus Woesearchaeota archaeon]
MQKDLLEEDLEIQAKAQHLIAASIAGLEHVIEKHQRARDICFGMCNYFSESDLRPQQGLLQNPFQQYQKASEENSRPYKVAEAVEEIHSSIVLKEDPSPAIKHLLETFPKEKNFPSVDISVLVKCAELLELASSDSRKITRKIRNALEDSKDLSGKVIFYDEKTPEKVASLIKKEPYGMIQRAAATIYSLLSSRNKEFEELEIEVELPEYDFSKILEVVRERLESAENISEVFS